MTQGGDGTCKPLCTASTEAAPPRRAHGTLQPKDESTIVGYYTSRKKGRASGEPLQNPHATEVAPQSMKLLVLILLLTNPYCFKEKKGDAVHGKKQWKQPYLCQKPQPNRQQH